MPVFSSSKGLLSVVAFYPNSSISTSPRPVRNDIKKAVQARDLSEYGSFHHYDMEVRGQPVYWNEACACYKPGRHPQDDEYDITTYITTTATALITLEPSSTREPHRPKPTKGSTNSTTKSQEMRVDPGAFAGLFLGITGACLQRRSGVLVCTSNSL